MADLKSAVQTVHHIIDGAVSMYIIDARHAIGAHPKEWSKDPWPEEATADAKEAAAAKPAPEAPASSLSDAERDELETLRGLLAVHDAPQVDRPGIGGE